MNRYDHHVSPHVALPRPTDLGPDPEPVHPHLAIAAPLAVAPTPTKVKEVA